jgi:cell filamentation protein, protein adenylyltransferase
MKIKRLFYADMLETHRILFDAVYPWAGQDRQTTAPDLGISKGPVLFAHPQHIRRAVDYALAHGQDREFMREKPGVVMGYLAYGHPFLDGNGRTIIVMHGVMAQCAAISIDWAATDKAGYLGALTKELDDPDKGYLDAYLKPFIREAVGQDRLAVEIALAPGLDGNDEQNEVVGKTSDPALKARYEQQELKRKRD